MKRLLRASLCLFATHLLVGCSAHGGDGAEVAKRGGEDMQLLAQTSSRTANDGIHTLWSEGDAINVFHRQTSTNHIVSDGAFSLADVASARFTGALNADADLLVGATYDWYAIYPYRSGLSSADGTGASYTIGSAADSRQRQQGNGSTAHMAGEYMPLVGVATEVQGSDTPQLTMTNAASAVEILICNGSNEPIAISDIDFSIAGHSLVGAFNIDFRKIADLRYTPCEGEVADTAGLQVVGGEYIAPSAEASFHLAIAPLVADKGTEISFVIRLADGTLCAKSKPLASATAFEAGKSKRIKLNYNSELDIVDIPTGNLPPFYADRPVDVFGVRAMCYNVHCCKGTDGVVSYDRVAEVISSHNVDVAALQELDSMTTRFPGQYQLQNLADRVGMYATFGKAINSRGGGYGVGVLTKEKPLSVRRVALPCSSEPRLLLIVELERYYFCSTHFSLLADYRLQAVDILIAEARKLDKPVVIAGDFNAVPSSDVMTNYAKHFFLPRKIGSPLTFPSGNPTKEIDYITIYNDGSIALDVEQHWVPDVPIVSDHRPVVIDMEIQI